MTEIEPEAVGELTMKSLRPYWPNGPGRATVVESNATEEQRRSGIVVPTAYEGDDGVKRGVVLEATDPDALGAGAVVFYRNGTKIGDVVVVNLADVIAYESDLAWPTSEISTSPATTRGGRRGRPTRPRRSRSGSTAARTSGRRSRPRASPSSAGGRGRSTATPSA